MKNKVQDSDVFSTEDLIHYLQAKKNYQAREARMIVRDFLDALDIPLSLSKNIVFRGHFLLKKKKLNTRFICPDIIRRYNPTIPLSDKVIVARRNAYKFIPSSQLKEKIKASKILPDKEFKTMMSDRLDKS
jgi:nucleoid DNA-binding protein